MKIRVPHNLPQEEAVSRLQSFAEKLRNKYKNIISNEKQKWIDNNALFSFSAKGFPISGSLSVLQNEIIIEGKLPVVAIPIKNKIEEIICKNVNEALKK